MYVLVHGEFFFVRSLLQVCSRPARCSQAMVSCRKIMIFWIWWLIILIQCYCDLNHSSFSSIFTVKDANLLSKSITAQWVLNCYTLQVNQRRCCFADSNWHAAWWLLLLMQGMVSTSVLLCLLRRCMSLVCSYYWPYDRHWLTEFRRCSFPFFAFTGNLLSLFFDAVHEYSIPSLAILQWHFGVQSTIMPISLP